MTMHAAIRCALGGGRPDDAPAPLVGLSDAWAQGAGHMDWRQRLERAESAYGSALSRPLEACRDARQPRTTAALTRRRFGCRSALRRRGRRRRPRSRRCRSSCARRPDGRMANIAGVSLLVGLILFSTVTALLHLAGRRRWTERERQLTAELDGCAGQARPRRRCSWRPSRRSSSPGGRPRASPTSRATWRSSPTCRCRAASWASASWLPPASAQALEHAVDRLRARGEGLPHGARRPWRGATSRPRAAPSAGGPSCASATSRATGSN